MTQITSQNKDLFLNFIQDADLVVGDLLDILNSLKEEPSKQHIDIIHSKIKNLASHAQLIDLNVIFPVFDSISLLLAGIDPDGFFVSAEHLRYIDLLLNSLASMFKKWSKGILGVEGDAGFKLDCKIDSDLLIEIRAFSQNAKNNDISESFHLDSDDKTKIISEFIKEGLSIILMLKNQLAESAGNTDVVPGLQQTLSMLKGDSDVLIESTRNGFQENHAIHSITNLLNEMLAVLNYQVHHQDGLSTEIIDQFAFCIDDIENLLHDFNDPRPDNESATYQDLKNLFQRIKNAKSDQKINTIDPTLTTSTSIITTNETKSESAFLPIKLERIEDLGNLIGELVVAKNAFNNIKMLVSKGDKQKTSEFLKRTEDSFQRIISDLDSVVMKMRMQKVKSLFNRFPRMVRDLSKKTGKKIDLTFNGEEIEIDNRILSAVTDPLMHLVRNSLDHGIEDPGIREKNGKETSGIIRLSAMNKNGRTIIEIYDDGKGIDPDVLKNKAIEKGLISTEDAQNLTDKEARNLIFMPGFSTADAVTQISGRGVGMDVVMESIKSINGEIDIESQAGRYTKIALSLPLTISISKGLKIRFENELFLVPMDDIIKMTAVERQIIHSSKDHVFATIDNKIQPISSLNRILGYKSPIDDNHPEINLVIVKYEQVTAAIAVDEILGIEDIVVKPLPELNSAFRELYSGCSILSDGSVVLILNINACLKKGGVFE